MSRFDFYTAEICPTGQSRYIFICPTEPTKAANAGLQSLPLPQTSNYPSPPFVVHCEICEKKDCWKPINDTAKKVVKAAYFTKSAADSMKKIYT